MHLKNPFIFSIIIFTAVFLILSLYVYKFLIQPAGAISLRQEETMQTADSNLQVVSIIAEDLKASFFGTAFHINYNPQNYTYDHFTLGDYFEVKDDPLVLVNPVSSENGSSTAKTAKIIIGISLKRGQLLTKPGGILLKLYFKKMSNKNKFQNFSGYQNKSNEFSFSDAVFSSFDTSRKDLKNITFYP